MSDLAGVVGALGKGLSTGARTYGNLKELERRAQEDAKRLEMSMESLELNKKRFEFQKQVDIEDQAYRQRKRQSDMLRDALDREADMVDTKQKEEDAKALLALKHKYAVALKQTTSGGKVSGKASGSAKYKPYEISDSVVNKAIGYAQAQGTSAYGNTNTFQSNFGAAINAAKGAKNPWHIGGIGPRAVKGLNKKKKKGPPPKKVEGAWDETKLSDDELRALLK